ncbi:uncharacterized protein BDR25DRAFT_339280 [Lindgomyces ingoldianus]|uniref:Uncharacterized protein n=1 Tax=Lindgomyces ingoldianus TaxID=673940 RepID=A0ACB6RCB2_9PLEO|nr:uncharacterized protein BDR25DRAFT_339280 [Lindgomyces ingoldianus]KAF2476157.1 hypothetical protein BDR25DRAFT_339280 [Lindgomyces ingoldianus]
MISPPSRIGGCKSCRERRVECDKKRPRCSGCIAGNKPCGGYDVGSIFINVTSTGPPPAWRSQNAQKFLVLDLDSQPSGSQQSQIPPRPPTSLSFCSSDLTPSMAPAQTLTNHPNPDPTNLLAITQLFLDLYYRRSYPNKPFPDTLQEGTETGSWRSLLPLWVGLSPILDTAIGALATCFVGTQYQDENLVDQSRTMYLEALRMVQEVLPEPSATLRKDLLATTLVMSSTEIFMSNGGGASQLTHIEGATKLLREGFKEPTTFEELHLYVLNQGVNPSYRPLIRQLYATPRSYSNDLYFKWCELIIPLPNILATTDNVSRAADSGTPIPPSAISAILDDITALETSLRPWEDTLKTKIPGPWTLPQAQTGPDVVPFPLQFLSIEVCLLYNLHWTSFLLLLECRHRLISHLSLSAISAAAQHSPPPTQTISELASLICRSVQFCASNTSFAAAENIFLPLLVVTAYYTRNGDEERMNWCMGAFARIAEEQKIGFCVDRVDLGLEKVMSRDELVGVCRKGRNSNIVGSVME